jgi:phosphatidylglycerophosphate synthase
MLLVGAVLSGAEAGQIELVDAARQPSYVADLRKHLRPVCFPAPSLGQLRLAEKIVEDAAQNGVLDIPALVHAPIETWLVSHLWKTSIKPNQITFVTLLLGLGATCFYATGSLWFGTVLALVVGIFDGLDGKLARTKVETTELGRWEHTLDYVIEFSWWAALAHHFYLDGHSPNPYLMLILLFGSDLVDRVAKRSVKRRLGRSLDDVAPFDRLVRAIGGRRNIYIWIFAIGLTFGAEATAFTTICCWGAGTAVVHLIRAAQIRLEGRDDPLGRPR